jgi:aromatic ring-cleaving dioxygenase
VFTVVSTTPHVAHRHGFTNAFPARSTMKDRTMRDTTNTAQKNGALLSACRLYRKTSAKGAPYLIGRLGGLRVLVMPNRDDDEGEHTYTLLLGEAAQRDGGQGGR